MAIAAFVNDWKTTFSTQTSPFLSAVCVLVPALSCQTVLPWLLWGAFLCSLPRLSWRCQNETEKGMSFGNSKCNSIWKCSTFFPNFPFVTKKIYKFIQMAIEETFKTFSENKNFSRPWNFLGKASLAASIDCCRSTVPGIMY